MSILRSLLSLLALAALAAAQDEVPATCPDLDDTPWQEDEIGVGVVVRQHHFEDLFGSPQSVTVLIVERTRRDRFLRIASPDPFARVKTSELASQAGALAAVNGGFFNTENGQPIGLIKIDGEVVSHGNADMHVALAVDRRERPEIDEVGPSETLGDAEHAIAARPVLLRNGSPIHPEGWGGKDKRHPRTAVGTTAADDLVFVTVDGRTPESAGMTLLELARLMEALGCKKAMNLDGGGSTTMWIEGRGIVNFPCDNKLYDHDGERAVANAVLVHALRVVRIDEDRAELLPEGAWTTGVEDRRAIDGDCAEGSGSDAIARFELVAHRAGEYELQLHSPTRGSSTSAVRIEMQGRTQRLSLPSAGRWTEVDELTLEGGSRLIVEIRAADDRPLRVDALRLIERP